MSKGTSLHVQFMKIIISPAKKMRVQTDIIEETGMPVFLEDAKRLHDILKAYSMEQLKKLFGANDAITRQNYERYQTMDLERSLTPAVLAYVGLQYQSMAPDIFTGSQWEYVKEHLRILSGFYGVLKACDGVVPYRLEMQARLPVDGKKDLYGFWGNRLYEELTADGDGVIVNLASKEYSRAVEPWLTASDTFITCVCGTEQEGKVRVRATAAKMARGEMVRFMAANGVKTAEELKEFHALGYRYREEYSFENEYVYVQET